MGMKGPELAKIGCYKDRGNSTTRDTNKIKPERNGKELYKKIQKNIASRTEAGMVLEIRLRNTSMRKSYIELRTISGHVQML
jgi:hypothetical protein